MLFRKEAKCNKIQYSEPSPVANQSLILHCVLNKSYKHKKYKKISGKVKDTNTRKILTFVHPKKTRQNPLLFVVLLSTAFPEEKWIIGTVFPTCSLMKKFFYICING